MARQAHVHARLPVGGYPWALPAPSARSPRTDDSMLREFTSRAHQLAAIGVAGCSGVLFASRVSFALNATVARILSGGRLIFAPLLAGAGRLQAGASGQFQ